MNKHLLRSVAIAGSIAAALGTAATLFAENAAADTLIMAIQGTPASIDGEQALTSEGEMMMANIHGGEIGRAHV